jgi:hypothetical protein
MPEMPLMSPPHQTQGLDSAWPASLQSMLPHALSLTAGSMALMSASPFSQPKAVMTWSALTLKFSPAE